MTTNHTSTRGRGWAYTGAILGGTISIAANIAHSFVPPAGAPADWAPQRGSVILSMSWPILLFIATEILARVQWPQGFWYALLRFCGLLPVAGVAGLVSFRHLSALLTYYGEDPIVSFAGPLAIDGLMVMAAAALMVTGRNRPTSKQAGHHLTPVAGHATPPPATTHSDNTAAVAPVQVPTHLLPTARFTVTNHEQTHGRPISPQELSDRMNITPAMASHILTTLAERQPVTLAPALNGTAILGGDSR